MGGGGRVVGVQTQGLISFDLSIKSLIDKPVSRGHMSYASIFFMSDLLSGLYSLYNIHS